VTKRVPWCRSRGRGGWRWSVAPSGCRITGDLTGWRRGPMIVRWSNESAMEAATNLPFGCVCCRPLGLVRFCYQLQFPFPANKLTAARLAVDGLPGTRSRSTSTLSVGSLGRFCSPLLANYWPRGTKEDQPRSIDGSERLARQEEANAMASLSDKNTVEGILDECIRLWIVVPRICQSAIHRYASIIITVAT